MATPKPTPSPLPTPAPTPTPQPEATPLPRITPLPLQEQRVRQQGLRLFPPGLHSPYSTDNL
ncbi:hypothetical protein NW841_12410 [Synechococcus sp. H60.3]